MSCVFSHRVSAEFSQAPIINSSDTGSRKGLIQVCKRVFDFNANFKVCLILTQNEYCKSLGRSGT